MPRTKTDSPSTSAAPKKVGRPRKAGATPPARSDAGGDDIEPGEEESPESKAGGDGAPDDADGERSDILEDGAEGADDIDGGAVEPLDEDSEIAIPSSRALASESSSIERFDALQMYLREVQRHPLLTPEETHALAVKFLDSQDAATAARLVTANLRLVVKIAYEYRRAYKNIMDLIQEGNIGLMQAVKRYDPYRGVKLSSYAAWWIRAYILRFILNNWRLVKLGTTQAQRKLFFNLRKKRAELQALGIDPTNEEVAKALNVPENEVADMDVRLQASEKSLDAPVGDSEGRSIAKVDMMPSTADGPETTMADSELQGLLKEKLAEFRKTLVDKDKDLAIFDERLVADEPLTLQELGDRFGISRERVRQLEQRLTGKLREYLRDEMGDAVDVM